MGSGFDICGDDSRTFKPFADFVKDKLGAIVTADMFWSTVQQHQSRQYINDIVASPATSWHRCKKLPRILVDDYFRKVFSFEKIFFKPRNYIVFVYCIDDISDGE